MTMQKSKTFSLTLSNQMILGIVLTVLPVIGGISYMGISLYNDMVSVIESYDESKINGIEIKLNGQKDRIMQIMERAIITQEKASDALALAREVAAESRGNAKEVDAALKGIRSEVEANLDGLRAEMKALRKATTNPLGN